MRSKYNRVKCPGHPKASKNGFVYEHVVVAEVTCGRFLRDGEEVHHKNGDPRDNRPENLMVCASRAEHAEEHRRLRAIAACGSPDWRKCCYCKEYDSPDNLKSKRSGKTGATTYHNHCAAKYQRDLKARRLRIGQPWLYAVADGPDA